MRSFIAIDLTGQVQETLGKLQAELKTSGADVKWVAPKNIHLTLKFLGEISPETIERIKSILEEITKELAPFKMVLSDLGAFPRTDYPRVIWIGVEEEKQTIEKIAMDIEERLKRIGISREKRAFRAHITIGRLRSSLNRNRLVQGMRKFKAPLNLECPVDRLVLYKSTLTSSGPIYEVVCAPKLSK